MVAASQGVKNASPCPGRGSSHRISRRRQPRFQPRRLKRMAGPLPPGLPWPARRVVPESRAILWWIQLQLTDDVALDNQSAARFNDVRLIVDNALLQVEATTTRSRHLHDHGDR